MLDADANILHHVSVYGITIGDLLQSVEDAAVSGASSRSDLLPCCYSDVEDGVVSAVLH